MKKKFLAFSLIETSIVLMVAGIIIGISFKGIELIDKAKIQSTSSDIMTFLYSFDDNESNENINHKTKIGARLKIEFNSDLLFLILINNDNSIYKFSNKLLNMLIKNLIGAGLENERIIITDDSNKVTSIDNNDPNKKYSIKFLIK